MALQRLDHRQVGLLVDFVEDPAEVADGLMVVQGERERDPTGCAAATHGERLAVGPRLWGGGGKVELLAVLMEHAGGAEAPQCAAD